MAAVVTEMLGCPCRSHVRTRICAVETSMKLLYCSLLSKAAADKAMVSNFDFIDEVELRTKLYL